MKRYYKYLPLFLIVFSSLSIQLEAYACHAVALVNINQQNPVAGGIQITAASAAATCGCDEYWLDIEVRCLNVAFNGAPFAAGFHGPLAAYPFFQSTQMLKPACNVVNYPWTTIPYTSLCPGMTYQYRMRENHNGQVGPWCASQTFVVPGATQPLVAAANATGTVICLGDCVNLTSTVTQGCQLANTYTWDNGLGNVQNVNGVCPAVTTTYCVTITEACSGFADQACVTVNVTPPPANGIVAVTPSNFCTSANPVLALAGHAGAIQWQSAPNAGGPWTDILGATITPFNSPLIVASTCYRAEISGCGVGGITLLYSNIVCVTLSGLSDAIFSAPSVCDGETTIFTDLSTPIGMITGWRWDFNNDGVVDNTTQNPNFTFSGPGTYNVELAIIGTGGCQDSIVIPVIVNPIPVANFTGTTECLGTVTTFNNLSTVSTGAITGWSWDFGDGLGTSILQTPTYTYTNSGQYNVILSIVSDSGCTHNTTIIIDVDPNPVANFTPNTACAGTASIFTDVSTSIVGLQSWGWDFDNDAVVDNTTQNVNYIFPLGVGTYPVNLAIVDNNGCIHDTTINVNVSAQPTAAFTFSDVCFGAATNFTDQSNPNGGTINTWQWDFENDNIVDNTTQNPLNGYASAGNYTVELYVETILGCKDSTTLLVDVDAIPVANFGTTTACLGDVTSLYDSTTVNNSNIINWSWDFETDATIDATIQHPTFTYLASGQYNATLTVTSDSGCINTITLAVDVNANPVANFTPTTVCLGANTVFTDLSTIVGAVDTWAWDFNADLVVDDVNQHPTNVFPAAGIVAVNLAIVDSNSCIHDTTINVTVSENPIAAFTHSNECEDTAVVFTDMSNNNGGTTPIDTWYWDFENDN
ncbi:MAG: PKD domain-containing protein, partial [Flavobacteriales bacterium]|nr:PKD domain-containing protein [Flavobacteriales bacterium]